MADWSDADIKQVKAMWRRGATAAEIAVALGNGFTRGAVLGKIHRLGLTRVTESTSKPRSSAKPRPSHGQRTAPLKASSKSSAQKPAAKSAGEKKAAEPGTAGTVKAFPRHVASRVPQAQARSAKPPKPIGPMPIWALGQCQCRWPIGNLLDPPGLFCGAPTEDGSSWCPVHEQLVYTSHTRPRPENQAREQKLVAVAGRARF